MAFSAAAKFRNVAKELARVPSRVSSEGAVAIEKMWRRSYMAGTDPYGNEWAANKDSTIRKKGHDWVMVDSEETLNKTRVRPLPGAGMALITGPNARHHLEATENRPARPVLPLHGLPAPWRERIRKITVDAARKAARRG